jgi:hypothetical protein
MSNLGAVVLIVLAFISVVIGIRYPEVIAPRDPSTEIYAGP